MFELLRKPLLHIFNYSVGRNIFPNELETVPGYTHISGRQWMRRNKFQINICFINPVAHTVSWSQLCWLVLFTLQYKCAFAHCKNINTLLENHRFGNCKWKFWEKFCHKIFIHNSWWTNKLDRSNKNRKLPKILTVASCHVTYVFKSESTLYSCLNVKELIARSRHKIWSLSDCSWTQPKWFWLKSSCSHQKHWFITSSQTTANWIFIKNYLFVACWFIYEL